MVAGMKFLSKKGFNPQNMHNQKRVWEARQSEKLEAKRIQERNDQLKREREDEELAKAHGETPALKFMYAPPPGLETAAKKNDSDNEQGDQKPAAVVSSSTPTTNTNTNDITQIQAGDDPAAAAFRRMLAAGQEEAEEEHKMPASSEVDKEADESGVFQGTSIEKDTAKSKEGLSALEKAVGRRDGGQTLSLDDQVARFPQLKNAPMAKGMSGSNVGVSFKPLLYQLRNVRCLACGVWGHSRGERECPKSGWNPFALKTPTAAAAAPVPPVKDDNNSNMQEIEKVARRKRDASQSTSSDSDSEDSYRERKRRKKESKRRKKESKRRKRSRSEESPDRKRHKKSSKKSRRKESSRR